MKSRGCEVVDFTDAELQHFMTQIVGPAPVQAAAFCTPCKAQPAPTGPVQRGAQRASTSAGTPLAPSVKEDAAESSHRQQVEASTTEVAAKALDHLVATAATPVAVKGGLLDSADRSASDSALSASASPEDTSRVHYTPGAVAETRPPCAPAASPVLSPAILALLQALYDFLPPSGTVPAETAADKAAFARDRSSVLELGDTAAQFFFSLVRVAFAVEERHLLAREAQAQLWQAWDARGRNPEDQPPGERVYSLMELAHQEKERYDAHRAERDTARHLQRLKVHQPPPLLRT
jgi:hypothetical protein